MLGSELSQGSADQLFEGRDGLRDFLQRQLAAARDATFPTVPLHDGAAQRRRDGLGGADEIRAHVGACVVLCAHVGAWIQVVVCTHVGVVADISACVVDCAHVGADVPKVLTIALCHLDDFRPDFDESRAQARSGWHRSEARARLRAALRGLRRRGAFPE